MEIGMGLYSDVGMTSLSHTIAMMGGSYMGVSRFTCCCCIVSVLLVVRLIIL